MKKKLKFILFLGCFVMLSCNLSNDEITGEYVGSFKTNIDTIKLLKNNIYERKIYDNNKNKIFSNLGKYKIENDRIIFNDFLLNENDLNVTSTYNSKDLLNASLPIERTIFGVKINSNVDLEYFYTKQE